MLSTKTKFAAATIGSALMLSVGPVASAAPSEIDAPISSGTTPFVSEDCMAQVQRIGGTQGFSEQKISATSEDLCKADISWEVSEATPVSVPEAKAEAKSLGMNAAETENFVAAAAAEQVNAHNWKQTYWGGSLVEVHNGRTFYNGMSSWVASATDPGYHVCGSAGSVRVGFSVTQLECALPTAAPTTDAVYRFEASAFAEGFPVSFNVELHWVCDQWGNFNVYQAGG